MSAHLKDGHARAVSLPETIQQLDPIDLGPFLGMVPEKIGDKVVKGERWQIEGLVPMDGTTMISGAPESGKSLIALGLVAALLTGEPFAGDARYPVHPPRKGGDHKVFWLGFDSGWRPELQERMEAVDLADHPNLISHDSAAGMLSYGAVSQDETWKPFARWLHSLGVTVLVIDHLYGMACYGERDVNSPQEVGPLLSAIRAVENLGIVPLLVHHASKSSHGGSPMGSTTLTAFRRCGLEVATSGTTTTIKVRSNRTGGATITLEKVKPGPIRIRQKDAAAEAEGDKPMRRRGDQSVERAQRVVQAQREGQPVEGTVVALEKHLGVGRQPARTLKNKGLLQVRDGYWEAGPNYRG